MFRGMHQTAVIIFLLSYAGIAVGSVPGLALDRTGFALLGAIAMVACGVLTMPQALGAIDTSTILLLYALMVISAQLRSGGFYTWTALRIAQSVERPARFLFLLMLVSAALSAVLANDIVCLAFTPVLCVAAMRGGLNPIPFLLGLALASNIGSAATIIGNPQNMLIGQSLHLEFGRFLAWCGPPAAVSLLAAYGLLLWIYRGRLRAPVQEGWSDWDKWPDLDRWQSTKGLVVTAALLVLFFLPFPREVSALIAAGVLLCSRRTATRSLLGAVDWHLVTLFCGLFIVIRGLEVTGLPTQVVQTLADWGWDCRNLYVLTGISVVLSNIVSNVPATMLLVKFVPPDHPTGAYVLALSSTFAGNLITLGSIANLIVIEQARNYGVRIRFWEHARTGIPVTLATLAITALWIWWMG